MVVEGQRWSPPKFLFREDKMVGAEKIPKLPFHAPYGETWYSTGDDIGGGEALKSTFIWSYFHMLGKLVSLLDRHSYRCVPIFPVGD